MKILSKIITGVCCTIICFNTTANIIPLDESHFSQCQAQIHSTQEAVIYFYFEKCPFGIDFLSKFKEASNDPAFSKNAFFTFGVNVKTPGKSNPDAQFIQACLGRNWIPFGSLPTTIIIKDGTIQAYLSGDVAQVTLDDFLKENQSDR